MSTNLPTGRRFVGLSAGSSLLGVDAALVRAEGFGPACTFTLEHCVEAPHSRDLRLLLRRVTTEDTLEPCTIAAAHRLLGETYALAVRKLLLESRAAAQDIVCIGCPGLPLWHDVNGRYPATLSLGMTSVLAERTGITTLGEFHSRDVAVGSQGGPIDALVSGMCLHDEREVRVHLHLGNVASLIYLPPLAGVNWRNITGFEAAPATMLLDGLMFLLTNDAEQFDAGGKHAVQGRCLEPLLERWLHNHFFNERPPRCVPRREFGAAFLSRAIEQARRLQGSLHDTLCTMTHFVARAIVDAMHRWLPVMPARVLLSGRGVRNGFLWRLLEQSLAPIPLVKMETHGLPCEAWHAFASAGIAALAVDGVPVNLPSVTGATGARQLGQFTPGTSANWARCLGYMAHQAVPLRVAA